MKDWNGTARKTRPSPKRAKVSRCAFGRGARLAQLAATLFRFAAALAAVTALAGTADAAPDLPFGTAEAAYVVAPRERIWNGTVEAVSRATVSAQTAGRVAELPYDVNDFVEAGAVIVRLTDTEQRAALERAQAALDEAGARVSEASQELELVSSMYRSQTVQRARVDQAKANRDAALGRLDAARSAVAAAQEQLANTQIKAPSEWIVAERHVQIGELVTPGQPLMSGLSLDSLRVKVSVPQSMLEPIRKIGRAFVYVGEQRMAGGKVTFYPIADPVSNTFTVRVNLPARSATLYPGMFIKVGFVVGETQRLLIPAAAVVERSELTGVYVVEDGRVGLRQVRLGRRYGDYVEVLAGLDAGELVALDPVAAGAYGRAQQSGAKDHDE
jgi:RND family efflux transporter MFP subunit